MIGKWSSDQQFNDQLFNLNNDESTGTSSSSMVIDTSSSITGQGSSQSSKLEHLPRLIAPIGVILWAFTEPTLMRNIISI